MDTLDKYIQASLLEVGDLLHLTFMGGDEYVTVQDIIKNDNGDITWKASYYAELTDTIKPDKLVRIKNK